MIRRLAVLGVGLLGGSVAKAARAQKLAHEIVGIGRDAGRLAPALEDGTLDRAVTDVAHGLRGADFVVIAAPVRTIETLLPVVWQAADADAVITDVGSTKRRIMAAAERLVATRALPFVGSHPMAGSELSGYGAARVDLFRDAVVLVTPMVSSLPAAVKSVTAFWEDVGAGRVLTLSPDAHDLAVAAISHLPHVVAFALVEAVARFDPGAFEVAGRGFRDTTRIAASDPVMWEEIFLSNADAVQAGLKIFRTALAEIEALVAAGDGPALRAALARIKTRREELS